ncbi:unnamed protein product [Ilex paraguariensis]
MGNSFKDWGVDVQDMGISNANLAELKHLSYLRAIEVHTPNVEFYPKDLLSGNQLMKYKIGIGEECAFHQSEENTVNVNLARCGSISVEGCGLFTLVKRAQIVIIRNVKVFGYVSYDSIDNEFPNLKSLYVESCSGIEYLVNTEKWMPRSVLPIVERINLSSMQDLRQICHGHLPSRSFCELRELKLSNLPNTVNLWEDPASHACLANLMDVKVYACHKMKYLFCKYTAGDLGQLQHLSLRSCDNMEVILASKAEGPTAQENEIVFPKLISLTITDLPNLMSLSHKTNSFISDSSLHVQAHEPLFNRKVVFPVLESLHLEGLDNMKETWHRQLLPAESFYCLRTLSIVRCQNIINVEGAAAQVHEIVLPKLESLTLANLPNLMSFFPRTNSSAPSSSLHGVSHEPLFNGKVIFSALESLHLRGLDNVEEIWHQNLLCVESFNRLRNLSICNCKNLITIFPSNPGELLQNLVDFSVSDCNSVEEICEGHEATSVALPRIMNFQLGGLPRLKAIWWNKVCNEFLSFQNLRNMTIEGCKCREYLFSFSALKDLIQLQNLNLRGCDMMKAIIATERDKEGEAIQTIVFPQLRTLELAHLPELTCFYQGKCSLEFQSLEELRIKMCPKMQTFATSGTERPKPATEEGLEGQTIQEANASITIQPFFNEKVVLPTLMKLDLRRLDNLKEIWQNEIVGESFGQLCHLHATECKNLLTVVPSKVLLRLHKLEVLFVEECVSVEEVLKQGEDSGDKFVFPRLSNLTLVDLPNLRSFYWGHHTLEWPSLKYVWLEGCPNMQTFSPGILITPELDNSAFSWLKRFWEGDLNSAIQHLFEEGRHKFERPRS